MPGIGWGEGMGKHQLNFAGDSMNRLCLLYCKLDRSNHHAIFCKSEIIRNIIQCVAGRNVVRIATYSEIETFQARHEVSLFSGLFLLLTLFVHCFPNQSREVFQEVKGRFKTSGLILGSRASELKDCWRRRGRNVWSNQAKSPASKFVLCCLILSKNNIFSRKPVLQYKGGGCYLIGSFIYPCFLCHIIKLRLFRLIFKGNLHYSMQLKANGVHALAK